MTDLDPLIGIESLRIVIEQEHDLILDVDFRQTFREPQQIAGAGKRVPLTHIDKAEEVCDLRAKDGKRMFQDVRV